MNLSLVVQRPAVVHAASWLPMWASRLIVHLAGRLYFFFAQEEKRNVKKALSQVLRPGTEKELQAHWAQTRNGIIEHYFEKLMLGFHPFERFSAFVRDHVEITGSQALAAAHAQGRGVLLVTGHFGAVEYIPGALMHAGYKVTVLVHCRTPKLAQDLTARSASVGIELLDPKNAHVCYEILKHLKRGRVVLTQVDEFEMWSPYKNRKARFLGLRLGLDRTLDILSRKSGAPIVFGLCHRRGPGRFELACQDPAASAPAHRPTLAGEQCLTLLNYNIYTAPHQWYEWKKIAPLAAREALHENNQSVSIPGRMALFPAG